MTDYELDIYLERAVGTPHYYDVQALVNEIKRLRDKKCVHELAREYSRSTGSLLGEMIDAGETDEKDESTNEGGSR